MKTCRIVQRPKTYNHTVRMCKRPLVKKCHTYQESVSKLDTSKDFITIMLHSSCQSMVVAMQLPQTRVMVLHLIVMVLLNLAMGLMQHIPAQNLLQ